MRHSWHIRSTTILVSALFAQATLVVPGLEAAGLMGAGQRFGVDQDGNVVQLTVQAPVAEPSPRTAPTAGVSAPLPTIRYVMDENGAIRESARAAVTEVTAPVVPAVALETAPVAQPAPIVVAHTAPAPVVASIATPAAALPASKPTSPGILTTIATRVKSYFTGASRGAATAVANAALPPVAVTTNSIRVLPAVTVAPVGAPQQSALAANLKVDRHPKAKVLHASRKPERLQTASKPRAAAVSHVASSTPAKAKVARSPLPASTASPRYSLAIDSLKVRSAGRPVAKKLASSGIEILDTKTAPTSVEVHRLVVAMLPTLDAARKRLREVQPKLVNGYIISQNGVHGVYCGSYFQVRKAAERATQLRSAGVKVTIRRETVTVKRTTIIAGAYLSRSAARDISIRLRQMGIPATIVENSETLAELRNGTRKTKAV